MIWGSARNQQPITEQVCGKFCSADAKCRMHAGVNGVRSASSHQQRPASGPASLPVLSRLCASPAAADVAKTQLERFEGAAVKRMHFQLMGCHLFGALRCTLQCS